MAKLIPEGRGELELRGLGKLEEERAKLQAEVERLRRAEETLRATCTAEEVARALERARLYEAEHAAAERSARARADELSRRASRLQGITAALSKASRLEDVCEVVVSRGAAAAGAATSGLWLVDPSGNIAELASAVGYSEQAIGFRRLPLEPSGRYPVADAIRSSEPLWFRDAAELAADYPELSALGELRHELALTALPLMCDGECIGALAFTFDRSRAFFEDERDLLLVLAQHCAQAVERARLFERERRARAQAEAAHARAGFLLEASLLLSSSLEFRDTLARLATLSVPRICDWCAIEVATEANQAPAPLAIAHVDPSKVEAVQEYRRRYPSDLDVPFSAANVLRTGQSELHEDISDELLAASGRDPEHLRLMREAGMRSLIIAPVAARGKTFGALTFASAESGRKFGRGDQELGELLGRRAGIAVDNALLYEAAQRATRTREEVLAVVSHDLRNPLNVVLAHASNLLRLEHGESTAARARKSAEAIQRSAERMARLIEDLLDFSSMQGDTVTLRPRPHRVSEIISTAAEMLSALAHDRELKLEHHSTPDLPDVFCDGDRIIQALGNLLSNAVKVTASGGTVQLGAEVRGEELVFIVEDTGPGLGPEELAKVFDRYWRSQRSTYRGTGLGLTIARGIVEAHGGRMWAESQVGVGSRFFIGLPLKSSAG